MDAYTSSIADGGTLSKKPLLADDDHSACAEVGLFFESEQFEVKTAGDGIEALPLCTTWHPDAAFLATCIRSKNAPYATWHASACSLYSNAPCTS